MDKLKKFIPFCKVDAVKREVWGIVTAEVADKDQETCHYATTAPYYRALVDEMSKATDGKNIFPLREMHQLSAVGRGIAIDFRDVEREIYMGFKVVDDGAWQKCAESVYTGFSQGGSYIKKWEEAGKTYYTASVAEASLVDNPCLGVSHFAYVKTDGSVEMRKVRDYQLELDESGNKVVPGRTAEEFGNFHKKLDEIVELIKEAKHKTVDGEQLSASDFAFVGDPSKTSTWKLPIHFSSEESTKSHIRNALARFNQTDGIPEGEKAKVKAKIDAAARAHGIDVGGDEKKVSKSEVPELLTPTAAKSKQGVTSMATLTKAVSMKEHFGKAAEYHKAMAKEEGDMMEAMKVGFSTPEGAVKATGCYKNMAKAHSDYADHLDKMSKADDAAEEKKESKEEKDKEVKDGEEKSAKAAPAVDLAKTITDAVTAGVTAAMAKAAPAKVEEKVAEPTTAQPDLTKAIGDAFAGLKIDDLVKAAVEANLASRLEAPPQGFHLFTKANGSGTLEKVTSDLDTGI